MDQHGISDRRQLRRKLTFWRIAAFVAVVLIVAAVGYQMRGNTAIGHPHVAKVEVSGLITDDTDLIKRLDGIAASKQAKALIVDINSPGGTTFGGEEIFKAIRRVAAKKPVVSEIRTLGASAAYMIATGSDHIVASETSIVGSIGVLFQYPQVGGLMDKIGVSMNEIKSAPLKAEPSPFHPASDDAKAMIRSVVMDTYDWFVDLVARRRNMPRDKALALADGRVFTGRQALKNGLVDAVGSDNAAATWLTGKGIDKNLPVVEWKRDRDDGWGLFGEAAAVIDALANGGRPLGALVGRFSRDKLFLDGLVSVWHFLPQETKGH